MSLGESATPIGKARGLGSAHHGGEHWLTERVTSIALLLLGTWLIASLLLLPKLDQRTLIEWLHSPSGAIPMALLVDRRVQACARRNEGRGRRLRP